MAHRSSRPTTNCGVAVCSATRIAKRTASMYNISMRLALLGFDRPKKNRVACTSTWLTRRAYSGHSANPSCHSALVSFGTLKRFLQHLFDTDAGKINRAASFRDGKLPEGKICFCESPRFL